MKRKSVPGQSEIVTVSVQPLLTIPSVAKVLSLSRPKVYDLIYREGLPVMRFGKSVRISPQSLQRWLDQREQGA